MSDGRNHAVFEVDGEVYNLRISFNALAEFGKISQLSDFKNNPFGAQRALIWAGINAYGNKSVTLERAGDLCEALARKHGIKKYAEEIDRILNAGDWLKMDGGTDTGNMELPQKKPSKNTLKSAKNSPTESAGSPLQSSGT
jgi:hypothetical protein